LKNTSLYHNSYLTTITSSMLNVMVLTTDSGTQHIRLHCSYEGAGARAGAARSWRPSKSPNVNC